MSANPPAEWIVPDWPAPPGVRAFVTTRAGGVSEGPYASFNLSYKVGDDPAHVDANRARLRALLPGEPQWLTQVHGARVIDADGPAERPEADAAVARRAGSVCVVTVADCLPVLFCDRAGTTVAAAHAGWRGLAAGVLESTIAAMPVPAADILAFLGPGIGPDAFEVGDDVHAAFVAHDPQAAGAFRPLRPGKWLADLYALARRRLAACGVRAVYGGGLCTYGSPARFFSYRREPVSGRMAAVIWRASGPAA